MRVGEVVVDATVGNGYDTAFLARLVGSSGHVVGFDIQERAIQTTRQRLTAYGLSDRATLLLRGHQHLSDLIDTGDQFGATGLRCVVFNLGYLPGADKSVITRADTTLTAIRAACNMLAPGGLVTIMVYPGHIGGREEADAVDRECQALRARGFGVTRIAPVARRASVDPAGMPDCPYAYHISRPAVAR